MTQRFDTVSLALREAIQRRKNEISEIEKHLKKITEENSRLLSTKKALEKEKEDN